jgi:ubiquinone biosynthesis protein
MRRERKGRISLGRRSRQIADVLARHGFGFFIAGLNLNRFAPKPGSLPKRIYRPRATTRPEHLRVAIEELGPTFIKFGQMLSTRADLLPPEYQRELARLQDTVPPEPAHAINAILDEELGERRSQVFASIDPTPLAAASIGQVHAATLTDGTEVVIKIQRPAVRERIETDLAVLQHLAGWASRYWPLAEQFDVVGLVQEFTHILRAELDYLHEAENVERFAAQFAEDQRVHIPAVVWEATTARILTLERIRGTKVTDITACSARAIDHATVARHLAQIFLTMIFNQGVYHADPHPGNFFVEDDGRIGLVDFGMVGTIEPHLRDQLAALLIAVTAHDGDALVDALLDLGITSHPVNRPRFRRDLEQLILPYYDRPLGEISLGPLIRDVLAVARRHRLQLPTNTSLLMKTVMMYESLGAQLDPHFHLTTFLAPFARRLIMQQLSPRHLARQLGATGVALARLGMHLPRQAHRILGDLERGMLQFSLQPASFEPVVRQLENIANRLIVAMILAALIIGLALLISFYHPSGWEGFGGVLFVLGLVIACILGAYLVASSLRSGRKL